MRSEGRVSRKPKTSLYGTTINYPKLLISNYKTQPFFDAFCLPGAKSTILQLARFLVYFFDIYMRSTGVSISRRIYSGTTDYGHSSS